MRRSVLRTRLLIFGVVLFLLLPGALQGAEQAGGEDAVASPSDHAAVPAPACGADACERSCRPRRCCKVERSCRPKRCCRVQRCCPVQQCAQVQTEAAEEAKVCCQPRRCRPERCCRVQRCCPVQQCAQVQTEATEEAKTCQPRRSRPERCCRVRSRQRARCC